MLSSGSNEHVCVAAQRIGSGPRRSQQPLADGGSRQRAAFRGGTARAGEALAAGEPLAPDAAGVGAAGRARPATRSPSGSAALAGSARTSFSIWNP